MKKILLTLLTAYSAVSEAQQMRITSATWGGRDVTAAAAAFCNGKDFCDYKVSPRFIGDPPGFDRSFVISWNCGAGFKSDRIAVPHDATNQNIDLVCTRAPAPTPPPAPVVRPTPPPPARPAPVVRPTPPPAAPPVAKPVQPTPTPKPVAPAPVAVAPTPVAPTPVAPTTPSVATLPTVIDLKNPLFPLQIANSLHSLIQSPSSNNIQLAAGSQCTFAIRSFLKSGGNFSSNIIGNYIIPLSQFPVPEAQDLEFYHYSKNEDIRRIVTSKAYEDLFKTARKSSYWFVSAAADSKSSSGNGPIQVKINFAPSTLVLVANGDMPDGKKAYEMSALLNAEFKLKSPALESCAKSGILSLLAAEARGVGMIAYFGINNSHSPVAKGVQWMEILGPWAIQNMTLGN